MKKTVFGFILGICLMGLVAMQQSYNPKKSTAEVERLEGILVFMDSKPVREFDYLGTVKLTFGSTEYSSRRDGLIRKAKKEYPNGEGIIIMLRPGEPDKADVIKFKE